MAKVEVNGSDGKENGTQGLVPLVLVFLLGTSWLCNDLLPSLSNAIHPSCLRLLIVIITGVRILDARYLASSMISTHSLGLVFSLLWH
jgi:hypothetical protein